jgi:hypothetical protein
MKLYGDETFEEILQIQKTGVHPRGTPKEGFGEAFFGKLDSESLKKELMKTKNPFSDLVKKLKKDLRLFNKEEKKQKKL